MPALDLRQSNRASLDQVRPPALRSKTTMETNTALSPSSVNSLKLLVLQEISRTLDSALDLDKALAEVLRILSETLAMRRATVTLLDPDSGELVISASHGLTPEEKERGVYRPDEGVTGRIFRTAAPYVVPDIKNEPLFLDKTGARRYDKDRLAFIGVPVVLGGSTIGVVSADRLFDQSVSLSEDVDFLKVVATFIAQLVSLNEKVRSRVRALEQENVSLKYRLSKNSQGLYIVGESLAMQEVQRQLEKVAPTRATVLLLGESGTGKTLIAKLIHELSERKSHPFIKVNCAAIPENLLESELFGHEKGAFTSATSAKAGRFEDADKGTIFLDEVGELPMGLQAKLLRVLQDREFERLGSGRTRKVDVRILAATNLDLGKLAERGAFRADLYYRLNVFPILAPPLRERKEDVPRLLNHFLRKVSKQYNRRLFFSPESLRLLREYDWPGNVREMENLIERLVILAEGERIETPLIRPYIGPAPRSADPAAPESAPAVGLSLSDIEKSEVLAALRRHGWVQHKAARDLGITPRQMGYRVRKYNLEPLVAEERAKARSLRRR